MPTAGAAGKAAAGAAAEEKSDWISGLAGPTAHISCPQYKQRINIQPNSQGVLFDGSSSQPLPGTQLVGWDWEVTGRTAEGKPFQTSVIGATRRVVLAPGNYSVGLTVQAASQVSGGVGVGTEAVDVFYVVSGAAGSAAAAASTTAAGKQANAVSKSSSSSSSSSRSQQLAATRQVQKESLLLQQQQQQQQQKYYKTCGPLAAPVKPHLLATLHTLPSLNLAAAQHPLTATRRLAGPFRRP
jgi:hypothetical protein